MKRMRFEMSKVHGKCKRFLVLAIFVGLLVVFAACGKQAENPPASVEESKSPAPFSRGPTGPPKISAPTYPAP